MAINGSWKTPALSAFGAVLLLLIGWIATAATTDRDRMSAEIATSIQRIAVLEESNRNIRESQARIENVLEDIRRQLQQERHR